MKRLHLALILPCILFSFPALAEQDLIKPQIQGEVTFVNGGVGAMNKMRCKPCGLTITCTCYFR